MTRKACRLAACMAVCLMSHTLPAADFIWDGETSSDWHTGTNWQPTCSGGPFCVQRPPGEIDHAVLEIVGSLASDVATLSDDVLIDRLTISDGTAVNTSGYSLEVKNETQIFGAGSSLVLVDADDSQSNSNAFVPNRFHLSGGARISLGGPGLDKPLMRVVGAGSTIGTGSFLSGSALVNFSPNVANPSIVTSLSNSGTISARFGELVVFSLNNSMFDLDGGNEAGVLDADDGTFLSTNVLLTIDAPLADPFHGTARIGQGDRIHFVRPWQFGSPGQAGGVIELNGGTGVATLSGGRVDMFGANLGTQINVVSGTGALNAELNASTGLITASPNTTLHFRQRATLGSNAFLVGQNNYNLIVDDRLSISQSQFDWDSPAPGSHDTIVNEGGWLFISSDEINPGDNTFRGEVTLNGGWLTVNTSTSWQLEGKMSLRRTGNQIAQVFGAPLVVGDGFDVGDDARIEVSDGLSQIRMPVTFRSDAEIEFINASTLSLSEISNFHTGVQVSGPGTIINNNMMTAAGGVSIGGHLQNFGSLNVGGNNQFGDLMVGEYSQATTSQMGRLNLELQSTTPGEFDRLVVGGAVALGGTLAVDWLGPGLPGRGDLFPIISASNVAGMFGTLLLPPVEPGNAWNIRYNPTSVIMEVVPNLPGDFDIDGDVDGRDFLLWQRDPNVGDLADWQVNYGAVGSLTATQAVPETLSVTFLLLAGAVALTLQRKL